MKFSRNFTLNAMEMSAASPRDVTSLVWLNKLTCPRDKLNAGYVDDAEISGHIQRFLNSQKARGDAIITRSLFFTDFMSSTMYVKSIAGQLSISN